jgi:hypothetical protein
MGRFLEIRALVWCLLPTVAGCRCGKHLEFAKKYLAWGLGAIVGSESDAGKASYAQSYTNRIGVRTYEVHAHRFVSVYIDTYV